MRLLFFLLFIIVPVIEIYLFIKVGGLIGAGNTILIIIGTAIIGANMLRSQGLQTLARIQDSLQRYQLPAKEMVEGILIIIGGVFLLTPGFLTDSIGFLCLLPVTRRALIGSMIKLLGGMFNVQYSATFDQQTRPHTSTNSRPSPSSKVIEGEFSEENDNKNKP